MLRNRHLVHLHRQCNRGVVAEQDEHFRDALAAEHLFDLREFGVRQLRTAHQRRGKSMDGAFMCIGKLRILAGEDRVHGLLRQAGGLALADMGLPDVVACQCCAITRMPISTSRFDSDENLLRKVPIRSMPLATVGLWIQIL